MDDDSRWKELLKRLDHWYSLRAVAYTPEIATSVVSGLEAVLDEKDETADEFRAQIKTQFAYSGAQIGARSFYSSFLAATRPLVDVLDTPEAEAKYGRVHNVSIRPFLDAMQKIDTFVAVVDLLQEGNINDQLIDVGFSATFRGLDGFLLYDREFTSARQEMLRVTLGEDHPEVRMLRKYDAPLQIARDTYHSVIFADLPKLYIKIPTDILIDDGRI